MNKGPIKSLKTVVKALTEVGAESTAKEWQAGYQITIAAPVKQMTQEQMLTFFRKLHDTLTGFDESLPSQFILEATIRNEADEKFKAAVDNSLEAKSKVAELSKPSVEQVQAVAQSKGEPTLVVAKS